MKTQFANIFSPHGSWEELLVRIQRMDPLPQEKLEDFLDFLVCESKEDSPDPRICGAALLWLEKSGFIASKIESLDVQYLNAIGTLTSKYDLCRLNSIRFGPNPVYLNGPPLPPLDNPSRVTGDMAGVP